MYSVPINAYYYKYALCINTHNLGIVVLCHPYLIVRVAQLCESVLVQQAGVAQLAVGVHHLLTLQEHTTDSKDFRHAGGAPHERDPHASSDIPTIFQKHLYTKSYTYDNRNKKHIIIQAVKTVSQLKEQHSVPPKGGKAVNKRNQRWRWCPPLFPSLQQHFPVALQRTGIAAGRRTTWLPTILYI